MGIGNLGSIFGGGGASFKIRRQRISAHLEYHETREMAYLQSYPMGGTLDGVADEIRANPAKEKVYFVNVDLGDWDRKIMRVAKPIVNWPNKAEKWVGEPVSFMDVQFGYPNAKGEMQWDGHVFSAEEGPGAAYSTAVAMKKLSDVENPPAGWAPDKLLIRRTLHFAESASPLENPFARVQVEVNEVSLDGDEGTFDDRIAVEVRAESAGALAVGPIMLGVNLTDSSQVVEVTMKAQGKRIDGADREPVKFTWNFNDQNEPRYWLVYTGQPDFEPKFDYSVRVVVKGTLFSAGQEWSHKEPVPTGGSGGFTVSVPLPDSPLVNKKSVPLSAFHDALAAGPDARPSTPPNAPPATPGTGQRPPGTGQRPPATPHHAPPARQPAAAKDSQRPPAAASAGSGNGDLNSPIYGSGSGSGNGAAGDSIFVSLSPTSSSSDNR
jgi:hypothetical protein